MKENLSNTWMSSILDPNLTPKIDDDDRMWADIPKKHILQQFCRCLFIQRSSTFMERGRAPWKGKRQSSVPLFWPQVRLPLSRRNTWNLAVNRARQLEKCVFRVTWHGLFGCWWDSVLEVTSSLFLCSELVLEKAWPKSADHDELFSDTTTALSLFFVCYTAVHMSIFWHLSSVVIYTTLQHSYSADASLIIINNNTNISF